MTQSSWVVGITFCEATEMVVYLTKMNTNLQSSSLPTQVSQGCPPKDPEHLAIISLLNYVILNTASFKTGYSALASKNNLFKTKETKKRVYLPWEGT